MSRRIIVSLIFILALTFMISCSGGDGNIVTPDPANRENVAVESTGGTLCTGLWQVVIDTNTGTGDIVRLRSADKIINVLGFMEPPPLSLMDLDWANLVIADPVIEVGVILTHPIAGDAVFTGFDVRGICFGPAVNNADGLTVVTSPEYFSGVPFGYQDGLLGAPDSVGNYSGLAGYKYFCDGLGATEDLAEFMSDTGNVADRGSYGAGNTNQRDYILDWTNSDQAFFVFNYAIYANYDWPVGAPPINLDSFEITTANSAEAFACKVTELSNSLYFAGSGGGGAISLQVEVWDWQGDISDVTVESMDPGIITQTGYDVALGAFPSGASYGYEFYAVPASPTEVGELDILITAVDSKNFGECWFMDLLDPGHALYAERIYNSFIHTTNVIDCPPAVVTAIDPEDGWEGEDIEATITGEFIDGTSLAVKLTMSGETDIVADYVFFVSSTTITCDIDLTGAAVGDWTVVVTNGCGVDGELVDGFNVKGCPTTTLPSVRTYWGGSTTGTIYAYMGVTVTRGTNNYLIGYAYPYGTDGLRAIDLDDSWTGSNFHYGAACPSSYSILYNGGMVVDDDDRVYYLVNTNTSGNGRYTVYYMDWDQTTETFSSYTAMPAVTAGTNQYCNNLALDDDNNPIVFSGYSSSTKYVHHWDPGTSTWTGILLNNAQFVSNTYYNNIKSFGWNEDSGTYVFCYYNYVFSPVFKYQAYLLCMDDTGQEVWSDDDIFSFNTYPYFQGGMWIDYQDSQCRILCFGTGGNNIVPWYRCNAIGGDVTTGDWNMGSYYPSYYGGNVGWSNEKERLYMPQQTASTIYLTMPSDW
jgi:hypothetical protein